MLHAQETFQRCLRCIGSSQRVHCSSHPQEEGKPNQNQQLILQCFVFTPPRALCPSALHGSQLTVNSLCVHRMVSWGGGTLPTLCLGRTWGQPRFPPGAPQSDIIWMRPGSQASACPGEAAFILLSLIRRGWSAASCRQPCWTWAQHPGQPPQVMRSPTRASPRPPAPAGGHASQHHQQPGAHCHARHCFASVGPQLGRMASGHRSDVSCSLMERHCRRRVGKGAEVTAQRHPREGRAGKSWCSPAAKDGCQPHVAHGDPASRDAPLCSALLAAGHGEEQRAPHAGTRSLQGMGLQSRAGPRALNPPPRPVGACPHHSSLHSATSPGPSLKQTETAHAVTSEQTLLVAALTQLRMCCHQGQGWG